MSIEGLAKLYASEGDLFRVALPGSELWKTLGGYYVAHPNSILPGETLVKPRACSDEAKKLLRWCQFTFEGKVRCSDQRRGRITKSDVLDLLPYLAAPGRELSLDRVQQTFKNPWNYHIGEPYPLEEKLAQIQTQVPERVSRSHLTVPEVARSVSRDTPRRAYSSQVARSLRNEHKGQYKLYLSECDFVSGLDLTKKILFLYPGGGPGHHVKLMAARHPNIFFVLVDPVFERPEISPEANVIIIPTLFDPTPFLGYSDLEREDWEVVLISDIRSEPTKAYGAPYLTAERKTKAYRDLFEKEVWTNMLLQRQWVLDLKPSKAMLKFRLNFNVRGTTRYLAGARHYQVWAPPESAEQRLMVVRKADGTYEETDYDHQTYEEQMFWFNSVYRPAKLPGIYANYDLARTADILSRYLGVNSDAEVVAFLLLMDEFFVSTHDRADTNFAQRFGLGPAAPARAKGEGRVFRK